MEFRDLVERAVDIRQLYAEMEQAKHGRAWTREEIALGFVGDVGDLAKPVMAHSGVRDIPDAEAKLTRTCRLPVVDSGAGPLVQR